VRRGATLIRLGYAAALGLVLLAAAAGCAHLGHPSGHRPQAAPEGMVLVPAGAFVFGTSRTDEGEAADLGLPYTWYSDATPEQMVELDAFYIDRYEMTNAEYLRFLNETEIPLDPPAGWDGDHFPEGEGDYPVAGLNWYEAYLACQHFGKRLPTEAEWEKAARGTDGRLYPWGDDFDESKANVATGGAGHLMPVGSYPQGASPYGVMDMVGNVWEWTRDWYRPYPGSTYVSDGYGKEFKVLRGNSFAMIGHFDEGVRHEVTAEMSRANYRFAFNPKGRFRDSGVRCAMPVP
jgi:formylglycine-generating enzyme required for sulfatase activity